MEQLENFGDERQSAYCVHCAGQTDTRDHVPSRVLLDEPYPPNLPVVPACRDCNEEASADEEYVACLVECTLAGSALLVTCVARRSSGFSARSQPWPGDWRTLASVSAASRALRLKRAAFRPLFSSSREGTPSLSSTTRNTVNLQSWYSRHCARSRQKTEVPLSGLPTGFCGRRSAAAVCRGSRSLTPALRSGSLSSRADTVA
jgi:hypothetical protein